MIPPSIAPRATEATRSPAILWQPHSSASDYELKQKSEQAAAENDVHNIPFPSPHSKKSHDPYNSGEPVEWFIFGQQDMHSKPYGEVHHHSDNGRSDSGECSRTVEFAAQLFDVRTA